MAIKKFKPTSPSRRFYESPDFAGLAKKKPEKKLTSKKTSSGGRNNNGRITVRFRGGGHKQRYRQIDFKRNKIGVPGRVAALEYDPNRSARIALIHYKDGEKSYILAPDGLNEGDDGGELAARGREARQRHAAPPHAAGHDDSRHRAEDRQGRPARPQRGHGGAAHGQGRRLRAGPASERARCAWCTSTAARPWARSRTRSTRA